MEQGKTGSEDAIVDALEDIAARLLLKLFHLRQCWDALAHVHANNAAVVKGLHAVLVAKVGIYK